MVLLAAKFRAYKQLFLISVITNITSLILIPLVNQVWLWPVLFISSFLRSSTPALANVMLLETEGVGVTYVGTAMGLMSSLGMIGGFIAPPLGNAAASIGGQWPFFVWAAMSALSLPLSSSTSNGLNSTLSLLTLMILLSLRRLSGKGEFESVLSEESDTAYRPPRLSRDAYFPGAGGVG